MEQQQRLQIEGLESTAEKDERKIKALETEKRKLEVENKRLKEGFLKVQIENDKLKKSIAGKLLIIEQLKKGQTLQPNVKKPEIVKIKQQIKGLEGDTLFSLRTISSDIQDDCEENPEFKVICNKITKKPSMRSLAQKSNQESTQRSNATTCTCENSISNKENLKANSSKPIIIGIRNASVDKQNPRSLFFDK